ncbi:PREDICTED: sialin-like [Diuraphis noxia]|uniref:sialin-like n=1 Tax=Diuraphis noxia TaxID=143948 RepID=UPI0007636226|nr:PREDICTED: sialin-like [Diuraphis noxia]
MQSKARLLEEEFSERGKIPGVRYLQSFLLFLCLFAAYLLRVSISVAIVAMTPDKNSTDFLLETHFHIPVFDWTQYTKSLILSAFFWGYLIMNLPAAMIGRRYNNQKLLAMSMLLTVTLSLVTPSLVIAFAFTMPMIHGISAKWAPPNERGRLVGFVLGGKSFFRKTPYPPSRYFCCLSIGMSGGALGLVVLGYMGEDANAAICMYVFVVAIGCCTNVGFNINHLDLAPNYAGILMGFTNAVAALGGVLAPTVCGFIVQDQTSVDEWRVVFTLGAVILFFSSIFYIIFGSAEVQPWNEPKNESVGVRSFIQMKTDYGSSAGYTSSPSSFVKVTSKYTMFVRQ